MSKIWAIGDLHLSFGVPNKGMEIFGNNWQDHWQKIEAHWRSLIKPEDLVLIPGDISWAKRPEQAKPDLDWIDSLPGAKALIQGNHDYWWESLKKVQEVLPPSCHLIQNNSFLWNEVAIGGTRLWDVPEVDFSPYIDFQENPAKNAMATKASPDGEKIFKRELLRLENSLKSMDKSAKTKIVMTHYPPVGPYLQKTAVSDLLEKYEVECCLFGHLHNLKKEPKLFGKLNKVSYYLTACDFLDFIPIEVIIHKIK